VERLERLELTDPHPELSKAMEPLERLERLEQVVARSGTIAVQDLSLRSLAYDG
jgi:hypothetical protein